ncbi:MAG: hypothetical protein ACT4PL_11630 [Phycisphaerales bacterium]
MPSTDRGSGATGAGLTALFPAPTPAPTAATASTAARAIWTRARHVVTIGRSAFDRSAIVESTIIILMSALIAHRRAVFTSRKRRRRDEPLRAAIRAACARHGRRWRALRAESCSKRVGRRPPGLPLTARWATAEVLTRVLALTMTLALARPRSASMALLAARAGLAVKVRRCLPRDVGRGRWSPNRLCRLIGPPNATGFVNAVAPTPAAATTTTTAATAPTKFICPCPHAQFTLGARALVRCIVAFDRERWRGRHARGIALLTRNRRG